MSDAFDRADYEATDDTGAMLQAWRKGEQIEVLIGSGGDYPEAASIRLTKEQAARLAEWLLS